MKESGKNRTEYQVFLNSLFVKYSIESPDESWSNSLWKVIVNSRLSDFDRENFYKELSEFNIKNPSDENWTHLSHEELKAAERYSVEDIKKAAERKRIADAKKIDSDTKSMKTCYSCKEEIKVDAHVCKHCGSLQDTEENREARRRQNFWMNMHDFYIPILGWIVLWISLGHIFGLIDIFDIIDSVFDYLYWTLWHDFYYEYIAS